MNNRLTYLDDPEFLRWEAREQEWFGHIVKVETDTGHFIERVEGGYQLIMPSGDYLMNTYDAKTPYIFSNVREVLFRIYDDDEDFRADLERIGNTLRPIIQEGGQG